MICFFYERESDTRYKVGWIHYKPHKLTQEQRGAGHLVDITEADMPKPEQRQLKTPVLYLNPQTNELWYEYIDRPPTQEELFQDFLVEMGRLQEMTKHQYPVWRANKEYMVGEVCLYEHILYEVIQAHISQADWTPPEVPALFKPRTPEGEIGEWVQPLGVHDAYALGAKVIHSDKIWVSVVSNNVWEPEEYGWELQW